MFGAEALDYTSQLDGIAVPSSPTSRKPKIAYSNLTVSTQPFCEEQIMRANGYSDRSVVGHRRNKTCMADEKNDNQDWLAAKISSLTVAEVVAVTGMSETAVQNIRRGKAKLSFDNSTAIFKAHPELGAAYMEYLGILLPGQAETAAAYTRFANAAVRGRT